MKLKLKIDPLLKWEIIRRDQSYTTGVHFCWLCTEELSVAYYPDSDTLLNRDLKINSNASTPGNVYIML